MSLTRRVVLKSIVVCAAVFAGTLAVYTVGLPAVGVLAGAVALWYSPRAFHRMQQMTSRDVATDVDSRWNDNELRKRIAALQARAKQSHVA